MPPAEGETGGQVLGSQVLKVINESTNQNAAVKRIEFVGPSVGADLAQTGAMALMAAQRSTVFSKKGSSLGSGSTLRQSAAQLMVVRRG